MRESANSSPIIYNFIWPAAILTVFVISFWPVLGELINRWDTGDDSYAYAVVPIFFYLCWDIRDKFRFHEFSWNIWGLVPAIFSVFFIFAGDFGALVTLTHIGIWGCITSFAITLYGARIRHLFFPFLMLAFIVPLPEFINNMMTFKLKMLATSISVEMLRAAGLSVLQNGNVIDMGLEKLQVVDACSGLRYFMSMIVISLLVGYLFVQGWWRRTLILLSVIPLSSIVNGLRIFIVGMLTANGFKKYTEDAYHDLTGIVVFMAAGALLVGLAFVLRRIGQTAAANTSDSDAGGKPVAAALPYIFSGFFCLLFATGGYTYQHMALTTTSPPRTTFASFPMELGQWKGKKQFLSQELVEKGLWSDDYVSAIFSQAGLPIQIYLLIPYYSYQATRHTVHAPEACLLGGGYTIIDSREHSVPIGNGRTIQIKAMTMNKGDGKLLATYFFLQRGRVITNPWVNKYYLMLDSFTKRRTDGGLVRVEMALAANQSAEDGFAVIDEFIGSLWQILPDYVPN